MKIVFEKNSLIGAVTPAMTATSNKNTISAVEGLLFKTEPDGHCVITAYDTEKGIRTSVEAEIVREGSYIINAQKFFSIIKMMPDDEITVTVNEKMNVKIESGRSSFELHALPGEDFPSLPELSGETSFNIPQHMMKKFINQTAFAISQKDQRPIFTGAYFHITEGEITTVSCDGNRLAKCVSACEVENTSVNKRDINLSFIVPGKTITELNKFIADTEDTMSVSLTRKHVIFTVGGIIFFSRLIDGEFIDYERIIPKSHMIFTEIDRDELEASLVRASLMIEEKSSTGRGYVKCAFTGNKLIVTSDSASGSVYDELAIFKEGEDITIGFNCRFLLDAVRAADTERIKISLSTPLMGISITGIYDEDKGDENDGGAEGEFLFFVMPVRMKE